jgi:excisionase family DNA binding protein
MHIEERIEELEKLTKLLNEKIEYLESMNQDKWVSVKELAEIMGCSVNNIYIKIREGKIFATDKFGSTPRIPLSQFYNDKKVKEKVVEKTGRKDMSMKEKVFGIA